MNDSPAKVGYAATVGVLLLPFLLAIVVVLLVRSFSLNGYVVVGYSLLWCVGLLWVSTVLRRLAPVFIYGVLAPVFVSLGAYWIVSFYNEYAHMDATIPLIKIALFVPLEVASSVSLLAWVVVTPRGRSDLRLTAAVAVTISVTLSLVLALLLVGDPERWPEVAVPPRQGEALDARALGEGRPVHSPEALARLVREPQNTWSNLAFVLAGALLVSTQRRVDSRLVALALIAVGVGSFLYHASASRTLRHLDVGAMYGLYGAMTLLAVGSFRPRISALVERRTAVVGGLILVFAVGAAWARNVVVLGVKPLGLSTVTAATAALFIGALLLNVWRIRSKAVAWRAGSAVLAFALAVVCQLGDRPGGWLLNPGAPVQAHALWHVFSALAVALAVPCFGVEGQPGLTSSAGERRVVERS